MVLTLGSSRLNSASTMGNVAMHQLIEHRLFLAEGHHGHAFHLALQHAAHAGGEHGRVAVRRADQNLVSVRHGDLFKALDQLREEGVGNVFNNDAQMRLRPETRLRAWVLGK
jgi:hypothetical protein